MPNNAGAGSRAHGAKMLPSLMAVYAAYGMRFIVPLLALPYLTNTLSTEALAIYLAVQAIGFLGAVGVEFGFTMWASRELAGARAPSDVRTIASGVMTAQILLVAIVFPSVTAVALLTPGISSDGVAVLTAGLYAVVTGVNPAWYFQGRMRASTSAFMECAATGIYLVLVFALVRSQADLALAMASMVLAPALAYGVGLARVLYETGAISLRWDLGWRYIHAAFTMFSIRIAIVVYTSASTWLMFVLSDPDSTARYGVATRIAGPILALYGPLAQVLLPYLHRRAIESGALRISEGLLFVGLLEASALLIIAACHLVSPFVVSHILMIRLDGVAQTINGLTWMLMPIAASQALVLFFILPHKKENWNLLSILAGAAVFVVAAFVLVPKFLVPGMIVARMLGESMVAVGLLIGCVLMVRELRVQEA
jgi:polysaccharide transporter, PST family